MSLTTDPNDPNLHVTESSGMNKVYLVLSEEERAKGFVRPVRRSYIHIPEKPSNELRDLTPEEKERYKDENYFKFEIYFDQTYVTGRFWREDELARVTRSCGALTRMGEELAETYARFPTFYGVTFCCTCRAHLPVDEFYWDGTNEKVGS